MGTSLSGSGTSLSDEIGHMAKALNRQLGSQQDLMARINIMSQTLTQATDGLTGISTSLAASSEEASAQATTVSAAAEQVSVNVQSVAAASEELTSSIAEIARSATDADHQWHRPTDQPVGAERHH